MSGMPLRTEKTWFGVVLECQDASELAHFYEQLLGWQVYADTSDWATLAPSKTAGYNMGFQRDDRFVRPVWPSEDGKQQMQAHLDLPVLPLRRRRADRGLTADRQRTDRVVLHSPAD
jgi:catechol-2,3-dioxygenase